MEPIDRVMEPLGVSDVEERAYRFLLQRPATSANVLAAELGVARRHLQSALSSLESMGLITGMPGRPVRYMPASPEVAVEPLIHRRQEELERVRLAAAELSRAFRAAAQTVSPVEVVQVIVGREAVVQHFIQLQESAKREILTFDRPPYAQEPHESNIPIELRGAARGVHSRTLYDGKALEVPGMLDHIAQVAEAEEARVYTPLPMKLVIFDRNLALVPLWLEEPEVQAALLVRRSPVMDALVTLFELVWDRAVPIRSRQKTGHDATVEAIRSHPEISDEDRHMLTLLAAGLKDQAIARQLGIGMSTLARRIRRIMDLLEVRTRFQAGLQAARLGWMDDGS
jgi:sugar-specific transcriptional regulator TrmB/DNA-binding CsgD family transcriptional regulator